MVERGKGEKIGGAWLFFLRAYQNLISPNWEKMRMKMKVKSLGHFGQNYPIILNNILSVSYLLFSPRTQFFELCWLFPL